MTMHETHYVTGGNVTAHEPTHMSPAQSAGHRALLVIYIIGSITAMTGVITYIITGAATASVITLMVGACLTVGSLMAHMRRG